MAGQGDAERLVVLLEAKINDFEKNLKKASGTADREYGRMRRSGRSAFNQMERDATTSSARINQAMASIGSRIGDVGKGAVAGFAAAFSVEGVQRFVEAVGEATGNVADLYRQAKMSGTSFHDIQTLGYAFKMNGVEVRDFAQALREMQDKASEFATSGGGRAADALRALGFTASDVATALKDPAEMLRNIIDRLGDLDRAAQIRYLGDIFGNADGDKFLRILDLGKQGIVGLEQQAVTSGQVITDAMGARADELDKKFTALQTKWDNWWKQVAVNLADAVDRVATGPAGGRPTARPGTNEYNQQLHLLNTTDPVGNGGSLSELQSWLGPDTSGLSTKPTTFNFRQFLDPAATDKSSSSFTRLADAATQSATAIDDVQKANDDLADAWKTAEDMAKSFASTFLSDLREGKGLVESLTDAAGNLGEQLLNMAMNQAIAQLFGALSGAGTIAGGAPIPSRGFVPGLTGPKLFASGTADTGGVRGEPRGIVHGREAVIPLPAGGKVPVAISGGGASVVNLTIRNEGPPIEATESQQRTGPGGSLEIEVMVDRIVAKKLGERGSETNRSMRLGYGQSMGLTRR